MAQPGPTGHNTLAVAQRAMEPGFACAAAVPAPNRLLRSRMQLRQSLQKSLTETWCRLGSMPLRAAVYADVSLAESCDAA